MKIDDKYKWLARDKNGDLNSYTRKPEKKTGTGEWFNFITATHRYVGESDDTYSFIKWEDKRPWDVVAAKMYADSKADNINKPPHYHSNGIDVIGFSEAQFTKEELKGFYRINAIKYLTRYDRKENAVSDLNKANFYTNKLLELETHAVEEENIMKVSLSDLPVIGEQNKINTFYHGTNPLD